MATRKKATDGDTRLYEYLAIGLNISKLKAKQLHLARAFGAGYDTIAASTLSHLEPEDAKLIVDWHEVLVRAYYLSRKKTPAVR